MMKPLLILALSGLTASLTFAQITLTQSDLQTPGEGYLLGKNTTGTSGLNTGGTGNANWDFSSLSQDDTEVTGTLIPSTTPYSSNFPDATHSTKGTDADGITYTYYKLGSSGIEVVGLAYEPTDASMPKGVLTTVSKLQYLTLPISSTYKAVSQGVYFGKGKYTAAGPSVDSLEITITLDKADTVSAYGNIKTPSGATYDALRLKTTAVRTITARARIMGTWTVVSGAFGFPKIDEEVSYNWWANSIGTEVFRIVYDSKTATTPYVAKWFISDALAIDDKGTTASGISIHPNPAQQTFNIQGIEGNFDLNISNMQGEEVLSLKGLTGIATIETEQLTPGLYIATASKNDGKRFKTKLVVQ